VGEDLEDVLRGMIAPDAGIDRDAVGVGRAGLADARVGEDAVAAVEPAVGAPVEAVQGLVVSCWPQPSSRPAAGRRPVVAVLSGMKQELGCRADPDAAEARPPGR